MPARPECAERGASRIGTPGQRSRRARNCVSGQRQSQDGCAPAPARKTGLKESEAAAEYVTVDGDPIQATHVWRHSWSDASTPTDCWPRSSRSYQAYLRARHAEDRFNQKGFEEALEDYREALRLNPQFARAAAALGLLQNLLAIWGYLPVDTAFSEARASAELAVRLDGSLATPHAALALTHVIYDWDWPAAKHELERATALEPRDPTTEWATAQLWMVLGDWNQATRHINTSLALDPLNAISHYVLSTIRLYAGHADEADAAIRRTLQISPSYAWAHYQLARILIVRGKLEDALAVVQQEPENEARLWGLASVNFALGRKAASDEALEQLTKIGAGDWAYGIAGVHAARGEVDEAFGWLDRAYAQKDVDLCEIKGEPVFAKIVRDPRYKAFLRKMNLPE